MGLLDNKRALIVGVASNRSIAWGIAEAMAKQGCEVLNSHLPIKMKNYVVELKNMLLRSIPRLSYLAM